MKVRVGTFTYEKHTNVCCCLLRKKGFSRDGSVTSQKRKSWDLQVSKGYGISSVMIITSWVKSQSSNPTSERSVNKKGNKLTCEWFAGAQKTVTISYNSALVEECYTFRFHTRSLKVSQEAEVGDPGVDRAGSSWDLCLLGVQRPSAPRPLGPASVFVSWLPLLIKILVLWGWGSAQVATFLASPPL